MSTDKRQVESSPLGPEGVPVDAPDNDAPAISPHAVSRTHRAEDDREAWERSPEFTDDRNMSIEDRRDQERWLPGAPGSGRSDDASRGLDAPDTKRREANPSHGTSKDTEAAPKGRGDSEMMDQPKSKKEARDPGVR